MNGFKLDLELFSGQSKCTLFKSTTYHLNRASADLEIKTFKSEWQLSHHTVFIDIKEIEIHE